MTTQSAFEAIRHTLMTGLAHNDAIAALDRVQAALHPAQQAQAAPTEADAARFLCSQPTPPMRDGAAMNAWANALVLAAWKACPPPQAQPEQPVGIMSRATYATSSGAGYKQISLRFADLHDAHQVRLWAESCGAKAANHYEEQPAAAVPEGDDFAKQLADLCQQHEKKLVEYFAREVALKNYSTAMRTPLFNQARAIMGTENYGRDEMLRMAILHYMTSAASPSAQETRT